MSYGIFEFHYTVKITTLLEIVLYNMIMFTRLITQGKSSGVTLKS